MNNDSNTSQKIEYIFGNKQFIGYIKFYKDNQDFGYLSSNNCGMNKERRFWHKNQDFYIDRLSFEGPVSFNQLVVFRPAYVNNKIKAINIVQYQVDKHRDIAINTILSNNIIHLDEKQNITIPAGRSGVRYNYATFQRDIHIFSLSGIKIYELIEKCCDIYKHDGGVALLYKLDNVMIAIGGDNNYYQELKRNYQEKEQEINAIKRLFIVADGLSRKKIADRYASFRFIKETTNN